MRYLVTTTDRNGAKEMERLLRADGKIQPNQAVQSFPNDYVKGAYDLYVIDLATQSIDLKNRKAKPAGKAKPAKPKQEAKWYDNADLATAIVVALLIGVMMKTYILN